MIIALIGTGCGFILGLVVGGIKAIRLDLTSSKASRIFKKIIDFIITVYITIFRGTPMMVQAVFIYYALLDVIHWNNFTAACFVITVNSGSRYRSDRSSTQLRHVKRTDNVLCCIATGN